jgi:trans-aconitate methyltransferase
MLPKIIKIDDFYELFQRTILPLKGHGKLAVKVPAFFCHADY